MERIKGIDYIKSIAIASVVIMHGVDATISNNSVAMAGDPRQCMVYSILCMFGRVGVPLFMMASGYLLLDRRYDETYTLHFYKHNFLSLFVTCEVWIIIYNIFVMWYLGQVDIVLLIKNIFFLDTVYMTHIWYLYTILTLYLFVPLLGAGLQKISMKLFKIPMIAALIFLFGVPTVNVLLQIAGRKELMGLLFLDADGFIYLIMMIVGYIIKKGYLQRFSMKQIVVGILISAVCVITIQYFAYSNGVSYLLWYDNLPLFILTILIFEMIIRIKWTKENKVISSLAKNSFGVYLMHNVVAMIMGRYIVLESLPFKCIIITTVSLLTSWICTVVLGKNKLLRKFVLADKG